MTQALATRDQARALVKIVRGNDFKEQVALALPEGMNPDRFVRVMATALLENPDLAVHADHNSIFQAGLKAAADGLLPDGREAAFVLFKDKCAYLPMVGGFRKIAGEYGWALRSAVVYANDEFEYGLGLEPYLIHRPARPGTERGIKVAAYAIAIHKDGRREFEVMGPQEIAKARAVARTQAIWNAWEDQMWEKTPAKRLFKKLPLDEKDKARVERIAAADVTPEESTRLVYGRVPGELPPSSSVPPDGAASDGAGAGVAAPASGTAPDGGSAQQAAPETANEPSGSSSPPSGAVPAPEPPAPAKPAVEVKKPNLNDAANTIITGGGSRYDGKTIKQVHKEDGDAAYLAYLASDAPWEETVGLSKEDGAVLRAAARVYCERQLPETLKAQEAQA